MGEKSLTTIPYRAMVIPPRQLAPLPAASNAVIAGVVPTLRDVERPAPNILPLNLPTARPANPQETQAILRVVGPPAPQILLSADWDWRRVFRQLAFLQSVLDIFK